VIEAAIFADDDDDMFDRRGRLDRLDRAIIPGASQETI
jgi:hypothetical protein